MRHILRQYKLSDIELYKSNYDNLSRKLYDILVSNQKTKKFSSTFGILDPVQAIQVAPYVDLLYVSGWQCSSTASTTNEPGPDLADYPMNTVPNKVHQLFSAQQFHSRKFNASGNTTMAKNVFRPIIADADAGHGGITAIMKLTKLMIDAGASGIHIEDQLTDAKKCGHMGGKVLVSTRKMIERLQAARLQADLMNSELVIIARTDSESARYIETDIDPRDQKFILGKPDKNGPEMTFMEYLKNKVDLNQDYLDESWKTCRDIAKSHNINVKWSPNYLRSDEGYYKIVSGIDYSIDRCTHYTPYADMLWMETSRPDLDQAKKFADTVRQNGVSLYNKDPLLAYNLSPSFNWKNVKNTDTFMKTLGEYGFVWQFITLAGFHVNSLAITTFARDFQQNGMMSYVNDIQNKERELNVETLKHQEWSGANLIDDLVKLIKGRNNVINIMSNDNTENQFKALN